MNLDPATAPKRPDLGFLTVRSARAAVVEVPRPVVEVPRPVVEVPRPVVEVPRSEERAEGPRNPVTSAQNPPPPTVSSSLDLDAPATVTTPPPAPPVPAPVPVSPPSVSSSLDLDDTPAPAAPAAAPGAAQVRNTVGHIGGPLPGTPAPPRPDQPLWTRPRLPLGGRVVLTHDTPAVTLSPLSAGIGTLVVEAAVSASVGQTILTCAYELESDVPGGNRISTLLSRDGRTRVGPPDSRYPVLISGHDQFAKFSVDLRQIARLRRLLVMLVSATGVPLQWAGTIIVTTHNGGRVEVPLDPAGTSSVCGALAVYQVRGELVVRAELEPAQSVREASQMFGYDAITWIDDYTPLA